MKEEKIESMDYAKQKAGLDALNKALGKLTDTVKPKSITLSPDNERRIPRYIPNKKS